VTSHGTPPRNILQENTGFLWVLGGRVPDQVQLVSLLLLDSVGVVDARGTVDTYGDTGDWLEDNTEEGNDGEKDSKPDM